MAIMNEIHNIMHTARIELTFYLPERYVLSIGLRVHEMIIPDKIQNINTIFFI